MSIAKPFIKHLRLSVLELLKLLRSSIFRRPILAFFVRLHNFAYHLTSFFASADNYHPKHDIINYRQFFTDNLKTSDHVLDIGCSTGELSSALAGKACRVVGIDTVSYKIDAAKAKYSLDNLTFITADATTYTPTRSFDVIVLSNVLEHIDDRLTFLRKLSRIAPRLLIRVPLITRDWLAVYKRNEGFEYRLDDTHYIEYDRFTFTQEMQAVGLNINHIHNDFGELYAIVSF